MPEKGLGLSTRLGRVSLGYATLPLLEWAFGDELRQWLADECHPLELNVQLVAPDDAPVAKLLFCIVMGLPLRMSNLHAPTIPSGPTSAPVSNGGPAHLSFGELQRKKDNTEAELKALSSVLDSVRDYNVITLARS